MVKQTRTCLTKQSLANYIVPLTVRKLDVMLIFGVNFLDSGCKLLLLEFYKDVSCHIFQGDTPFTSPCHVPSQICAPPHLDIGQMRQ